MAFAVKKEVAVCNNLYLTLCDLIPWFRTFQELRKFPLDSAHQEKNGQMEQALRGAPLEECLPFLITPFGSERPQFSGIYNPYFQGQATTNIDVGGLTLVHACISYVHTHIYLYIYIYNIYIVIEYIYIYRIQNS